MLININAVFGFCVMLFTPLCDTKAKLHLNSGVHEFGKCWNK